MKSIIHSIAQNEEMKDGEKFYTFMCPGCKKAHQFQTPIWQFNGNLDKPTIRPSVLVRWYDRGNPTTKPGELNGRCHSFITDGQIRFLSDCTHELAGQTVELQLW